MSRRIYHVLDFGAHADGTLTTTELQAAIDACFLAGGGTVVVPAGDYLTGGRLLGTYRS